jgi:hypothetical protein
MKFIERPAEPSYTTVYAQELRENQAWINMSDIYSHYTTSGTMDHKPSFIDFLMSCDSDFAEYVNEDLLNSLERNSVSDVFDAYSNYIEIKGLA